MSLHGSPPHTEDGLRNALIGQTVRQAAHMSSFYRNFYADHGLDASVIETTRDLHRVPVVTKEMLRKAGTACLAFETNTAVSHIQHTSGTTGEPFLIYRSAQETAFIDAFFSRLAERRKNFRVSPLPIALQLQPGYHGTATTIPANLFPIEAMLSDAAKLDLVITLLQKRFAIPGATERIEVLIGGDREICTVTAVAAAYGPDFGPSTGVRFVTLSGNVVSSYWRKKIAETWNSAVIDKFSMSEVFGGATYCMACGGYHFDPHVVPELVSIKGHEPLESGIGMLLLSSLNPFVQLQPMIRYLTGDLFRLDPKGCVAPRYEVCGRIEDALLDNGDQTVILLDGVMVREVLDRQSEVIREETFPILRSKVARSAGFPRAQGRIRSESGTPFYDLQVEIDYSTVNPTRRSALRNEIEAEFLKIADTLRERVARGSCGFSVTLVPENALDPCQRVPFWQEIPSSAN
ncbi:hypothetical protein [Roseibium aggregatum]|uniref:hypothetical protein n=1 Tax=Roseibium aggregatum TaxID=187304 RepID=UPI0025AC6C90|nr:hypothetical protein [Roseibium aggregatum]WJS05539.1 hypothetical protein QUB73_26735 [Roseibium aggregatum]